MAAGCAAVAGHPSRPAVTAGAGGAGRPGLSDRQIGQRYGVAVGTVRFWRFDAELLRYHPSKRPSPQTLARLVAEGLSDRAIGQRYGKATRTVRRWRDDDGLVRTPPPPTVEVARVQELRGQGLPIPDVAAQLGYTPAQVPGRPERPGPPATRTRHDLAAPVPVRSKGVRPIRKVVGN